MIRHSVVPLFASLLLLSLPAHAEEAEPASASTTTTAPPADSKTGSDKLGILLEPRVGAGLPGVLNNLHAAPAFFLQVGYLFLLDQKLGAVIEVGYTQPSRTQTTADARLPSGSYSSTVTTRDLSLFVGPKFLFPQPIEKLTPFAEAGLKLHFLDTRIVGDGGAGGDFGQNDEKGTRPGFALRGGAAYALGPGAISLAIEFAYANTHQLVTGETNLGNLGIYAGYMMLF